MDLIKILFATIVPLFLLRLLSQPNRSKIFALLRSRFGEVLSRTVSGGLSIAILLLSVAMIRGATWLLSDENQSLYRVPASIWILIVLILCAAAGTCGYAVWRFARFAVTRSQKTSPHPL